MARLLGSAGLAFAAYALGMLWFWLLIFVLIAAVDTSPPRGGRLLFEVTWSVIAFLIVPVAIAAFSLAFSRLARSPTWWGLASVGTAVVFYGVTLGLLVRALSVMNDCAVGVSWPVSLPGCD